MPHQETTSLEEIDVKGGHLVERLVRIRDGKIVANNLDYDNLAVAAQLGRLGQDQPTTV